MPFSIDRVVPWGEFQRGGNRMLRVRRDQGR